MKEIVDKDILLGRDRETVKSKLKKILPKGYHLDNGSNGIFYINRDVWLSMGKKVSEIYYDGDGSRKIIVMDKVLYKPLRQFGIDNKFDTLVKKWVGADLE